MPLTIGEVLDGKYRIVRVIGEGGMGTVYEGANTRIHRKVAIKTLLPTKNVEEVVQRFEHEAQAAGRIGNEHILEVLDLGTLPTGEHYLVMEYLDGQTLAQRIEQRGALPAEEVALLISQVLVALEAAHGAGIVHRDLKPDNIFILPQKHGQKDFVKLIDFGISKFTGGPGEAMRVTKLGSLLGTPNYLSPELARGTGEADDRTDIYGLGVIMYEAVSRQLPFQAQNFNELLFRIVEETPKPLSTHVPDLDPAFDAMIMKAMARAPADRFQTAASFLEELGAWMEARGIVPRMATSPSMSRLPVPGSVARSTTPSGADRAPSGGPIQSSTSVSQTGPRSLDAKEMTAKTELQASRPAALANDSVARPWAASQAEPKPRGGAGRIGFIIGVVVLALGVGAYAKWRAESGPTPAPAPATSAARANEPAPPATPSTAAEPTPTARATESAPPAASSTPTPAVASAAPKPADPRPGGHAVAAPAPRPVASTGAAPPATAKTATKPDDEIPTMR